LCSIPDCITPSFFCTMQDGKIPIMYPAFNGHRELVEILFPKTRPVSSLPDWSVDGIIRSMKDLFFKPQVLKTINIVSDGHVSLDEACVGQFF
jgi:hypothetical protein